MMNKILLLFCAMLLALSSTACSAAKQTSPPSSHPQPITSDGVTKSTNTKEKVIRNIQVTIGHKSFYATLEDNNSAQAFAQLLQQSPISISMRDYSGFEKVGALSTSLPEHNQRITTSSGDIILYNAKQIVLFYGANTWNYTKLGKIDNLSGWAEALGTSDVTVTFSVQ